MSGVFSLEGLGGGGGTVVGELFCYTVRWEMLRLVVMMMRWHDGFVVVVMVMVMIMIMGRIMHRRGSQRSFLAAAVVVLGWRGGGIYIHTRREGLVWVISSPCHFLGVCFDMRSPQHPWYETCNRQAAKRRLDG